MATSSPHGTDRIAIRNKFSNLECLFDLNFRASGNRLLDKHCHPGEILHDLHFNIATGLLRPTEHRRASNDNGPGSLLLGHVLDKIVQCFVNTRVLVRGDDKRVAFLLEDSICTLNSRIDNGNDLETQAEFAEGKTWRSISQKIMGN